MMVSNKRPEWLQKKVRLGDLSRMKTLLRDLDLHTVCEEALCPNISECFDKGISTFLILGRMCTRNCRFCNVEGGDPSPLDPEEPARVAEAVKKLGVKHVVITSVTRDDLPDGGAQAFCDTIQTIRELDRRTVVEVLVPDFAGNDGSIRNVCESGPDIFGHNLETIPRLYSLRPGADYERSLSILKSSREHAPACRTKSGLMLGMGESEDEVIAVMEDLRRVECRYLSLGQYLSPSRNHFPVKEYIEPERFDWYKKEGESMGFEYVMSGPYVRSSYLADQYGDKLV